MKFTFTQDIHLIARNICFNAECIYRGSYQKGGYQILPYLPQKYDKGVYFPDLNYSNDFWRNFKNLSEINYDLPFPKKMEASIVDKLNTYDIPTANLDLFINEWNSISTSFLDNIKNIFGKESLSRISEVQVLFTPFGSQGSFSPRKNTNNKYIFPMCLRHDTHPAYIGNMILSSLYVINVNKSSEVGEIGFYERMASIRFLRRHSILSKYFPTEKSVSNTMFNKYLHDSNMYLKKLGIKTVASSSISQTGNLVINGEIVDMIFTVQELKVLKYFINNKNFVVHYDTLSEILWEELSNEKFSLYAIAKVIENIRRKLKAHGLKRERIKTIRKEGYVWVE